MFCTYCGKEIKNNSAYCKYCGKKVPETKRKSQPYYPVNQNNKVNPVRPGATAVQPKQNTTGLLIIIGGTVLGLVFMIIVFSFIFFGSHGLEGTYKCYDDMTLTSFTFYKDGTVTATYDYCSNGYNYGDVYSGKYKKSFGTYKIKLDEKNGSSTLFDNEYEITAKKNKDDSLKITIHNKMSYFEYYCNYYKVS